MQILVSDSSVLIEFSKRDLLDRMFELSFQFAVPDLLSTRNSSTWAAITGRTWSDWAFASKPWTLKAWRPQLPIKAGAAS